MTLEGLHLKTWQNRGERASSLKTETPEFKSSQVFLDFLKLTLLSTKECSASISGLFRGLGAVRI